MKTQKSSVFSFWRFLLFFVRTLFVLALIIAISIFGYATYKHSGIVIQPELENAPVQEDAFFTNPFSFDYKETTYVVRPVQEYDISGLVVSHNGDLLGTQKNPIDLKDLCLIWGKNTETDNYKYMTFWSDSWTCSWMYPKDIMTFSLRDVSNNHLLAKDPKVRESIQNIQRGDQIRLKGMLVNYWIEGEENNVRGTSLSRTDYGGSACELMFVESVEILSRGNTFWRGIQNKSGYVLLGLILLAPFVFYRRRVL